MRKIILLTLLCGPAFASDSRFINELFSQPIMLDIQLGQHNNGLGFVKVNLEGDIKLVEMVEGELEPEVEAKLIQGVNLNECSKVTPCGPIYFLDFDLNNSRLQGAVVNKKEGFNKENTSSDVYSMVVNSRALVAEDSSSFGMSSKIKLSETLWNAQVDYTKIGNSTSLSMNEFSSEEKTNDGFLKVGLLDTRANSLGYFGNMSSRINSHFGLFYQATSGENVNSHIANLTINLSSASYVSVYRGTDLIDSQVLESGVRVIDTKNYPRSNYPVLIKIKPRDGGAEYEITDYVYNSQVPTSYSFQIGVPFNEFGNNELNDEIYFLTDLSYNYKSLFDVGYAIEVYGDEYTARGGLKKAISDFQFRYELGYGSEENETSSLLSSSYSNGSVSLSNVLDYSNTSLNTSTYLNYNMGQYRSISGSHRKTFSDNNSENIGVNYHTRYKLLGNLLRAQYGISRVFSDEVNETAAYVNFSFDFTRDAGLDLQFSLRNFEGIQTKQYSAGYNKTFDSDIIKRLYVNGSVNDRNSSWLAQTDFDHNKLNGSVSLSGNNKDVNVVAALNSTIYSDFNQVDMLSNHNTSGVILSIIDATNTGDSVTTSSTSGYSELGAGSHFIPIMPGEDFDISFTSKNNNSLSLSDLKGKLSENEIKFIQVSIIPSITVIGRLTDDDDKSLHGVKVENHLSTAYTDTHGLFVLQMSLSEPTIVVNGDEFIIDTKRAQDGVLYIDDIII
ncbi:TcfC E-set like domain-containing protein [Vibrio sp. E150_011]